MSRSTKLTPALQTAICQYVAAGAPLPLACEAAGVSWNTAKDWKRREGEPYASFAAEVKQAKARWAVAAAMRLTKASEKHYQAAQWMLERRLPQYYRAPTQRNEHTGKDGAALALNVSTMSEQQIEQRMQLLKKRLQNEED